MNSKKIIGYENSACSANDDDYGHGVLPTATLEMDNRVVLAGMTTTVAKCCGGGSRDGFKGFKGTTFSDAPSRAELAKVPSNTCQSKCPGVQMSPWDASKTRFAMVLTAAMVVWLLMAVYTLNF